MLMKLTIVLFEIWKNMEKDVKDVKDVKDLKDLKDVKDINKYVIDELLGSSTVRVYFDDVNNTNYITLKVFEESGIRVNYYKNNKLIVRKRLISFDILTKSLLSALIYFKIKAETIKKGNDNKRRINRVFT